jgi:RND family efflux transporter MFP subunit
VIRDRQNLAPRLSVAALAWGFFLALNMALLPPRYLPFARIELVQRTAFPLIVRAPATLQPKRELDVKAQFDGPVVKKNYLEGQSVKEGDVLLEIGRSRIEADFKNKSDELQNARADFLKAKKDINLQKALFRKQAVSESTVEDAERALVRAEQALKSAEISFELEKTRWNSNKILAPFSGEILHDGLDSDPEVTAGQELFILGDVSEYTLRAGVDELEIGQVKVGQTAEVRIQAFEKTLLRATVLRVGSQADSGAVPEIPIILQLESTQGLILLPRLTAEVRLKIGEIQNVFSVPISAIDNADGKPKVWVVNQRGFLEHRVVVLDNSNPDRVQVTDGLKENEHVCVTADPLWAQGMKVKPIL